MTVFILYTGSVGFPMGDSYTNRILAIAKGLKQNACNVKLLIIYPGKEIGVEKKSGSYNGIPYVYLAPFKKTKGVIQRIFVGILGIINTLYYLLFNSEKIDAVLSYSELIRQNLPIAILLKIKKVLFIRELNEYPRAVLKKSLNGVNRIDRFQIKLAVSYFDAIISISHGLSDYLLKSGYKKPMIIVPIVIDLNRFKDVDNNRDTNYITYCGYLYGSKDGLKILIKAYAKISAQFKEMSLRIIGDNSNQIEFSKLQKLIKKLNIEKKVEFTGFIHRDRIPFLLQEAKVLVLARPANLQAQVGFPSKLGEYLATGKPVVATSVGDIPVYIRDNDNGFLAIPGNVESFASKLVHVLENYEDSLLVGKKGMELTKKDFNNVYQANRILSFITNLKK